MRPVNQPHSSELVRAIGRWSLVALVLNSIIGSGIFGLPAVVTKLVGGASPMAYLVAAAGIGFIMVSFAEVSSRFSEAGGPYLYAREAFGGVIGIQIGWLTWLVRLAASAANANLFVIYLGEFWSPATGRLPRLAVLTLLVGFLAAVNYRGVRAGAQISNVFVIAKLVPLAVFIGIGLFFFRSDALTVSSSASTDDWLEAVLVLVYAYGGFEGALLPMAEAKNPKRDAPFALLTALVVVTILYTLIQIIVIGVLPMTEVTDRPLAAAARQFMGSSGAIMITVGALVSVYGYLSSMMLNVPRLTFALAERGEFPPFFARIHRRFRTPHLSILGFALLFWMLAVYGDFRWNVTLSVIARVFTYASTCAALIVFRKKQPGGAAFRVPGGSLFALFGVAFSAVVATRMGRGEVLILAVTAALALATWVWAKRRSRQEAVLVSDR
jgi:amino acid transporter